MKIQGHADSMREMRQKCNVKIKNKFRNRTKYYGPLRAFLAQGRSVKGTAHVTRPLVGMSIVCTVIY